MARRGSDIKANHITEEGPDESVSCSVISQASRESRRRTDGGRSDRGEEKKEGRQTNFKKLQRLLRVCLCCSSVPCSPWPGGRLRFPVMVKRDRGSLVMFVSLRVCVCVCVCLREGAGRSGNVFLVTHVFVCGTARTWTAAPIIRIN